MWCREGERERERKSLLAWLRELKERSANQRSVSAQGEIEKNRGGNWFTSSSTGPRGVPFLLAKASGVDRLNKGEKKRKKRGGKKMRTTN